MTADCKLFTIGPTQMYPSTLDVRNRVVPYFRTADFSEMMLENARLLKEFEGAEDDSELIVLTASGSGAMEATVMNCFDEADRLIVVNGGSFGERFARICEIHGIPHDVVRLAADETLTRDRLDAIGENGQTGFLVNLDETSTGQLYDLSMISSFCAERELLLVVDAISSFLCDPYHASSAGVDATIVSSQKGLCLAPGLSFVTLSPRMVKRLEKRRVKSLYFDFGDYIRNMKRGQTPFTPAVGICHELNDMLRRIEAQGLESRIEEVRGRCLYFRSALADLPVELPPFLLSNAITPVRFAQDVAADLFEYLKDEQRMIVNPSGGELGKRSIRISHVGDLSREDYDALIRGMQRFIDLRCA